MNKKKQKYGNPAKRQKLVDDLHKRLTELHQGKHVDLHFLKVAINLALEKEDSV